MMDKGCLGDGGSVEQVAEMRPFFYAVINASINIKNLLACLFIQ